MSPHTCHAEGCEAPVPPKMFMCRPHWDMVPQGLRNRMWATYRRGQEVDKQPSLEYLDTAMETINAVRDREASHD